MKTYGKITDLIGGTPLLKLTNYIKENGLKAMKNYLEDIYNRFQ